MAQALQLLRRKKDSIKSRWLFPTAKKVKKKTSNQMESWWHTQNNYHTPLPLWQGNKGIEGYITIAIVLF